MKSEVKVEVVKTAKVHLELDSEEISDIIVLLHRARKLSEMHPATFQELERTEEYIGILLEAEMNLDAACH